MIDNLFKVAIYVFLMFLMAEIGSQVTGKNQLTGEIRDTAPTNAEATKTKSVESSSTNSH